MTRKHSDNEMVKIVLSAIIPLIALILMISVKAFETIKGVSLSEYGLYPLNAEGLLGIITMPFLHEDWSHLWSNSLPILIIGTAIGYYYKKQSNWILIYFMILTGGFTWLIGRESYHIGASGMVYAMSFFILVSAIIKKERKLMAFALLVVFLYGSIIWGFFPEFFPNKNISWEGHLSGAISGIIVAFIFKENGPKEKVYDWAEEENETVEENIEDEGYKEENLSDQYYKFQNRS